MTMWYGVPLTLGPLSNGVYMEERFISSLAIGRTLQAVFRSIGRGMGQASPALPASLFLVEAAGIEDRHGAEICLSPCVSPQRQNYPCSLSPRAESLQAGDRPCLSWAFPPCAMCPLCLSEVGLRYGCLGSFLIWALG